MNFGGSLVNLVIQFSGLFGVYYLGFAWAIIPTAILLSIIIVMQTVSASAIFSKFVDFSVIKKDHTVDKIHILVALTYALSTYQIYLLGYTVFAGIAAAHVAILISTLTFGYIRQQKETQ